MRATLFNSARAVLPGLLLFVAACETPAETGVVRLLSAVSADGYDLPAVVACPFPADDTEAWVSFGGGVLEVYRDGTFAWRYDVGGGYRTFQLLPDGTKQYGVQFAEGRTGEVSGKVIHASNGDRLLMITGSGSPEIPVRGGGRLTPEGATMTVPYPCPHAPIESVPHEFTVELQ